MTAKSKSSIELPDYDSPADARGYLNELAYAVTHPDEEKLTPGQVSTAKEEIRRIKQYLFECDEYVY